MQHLARPSPGCRFVSCSFSKQTTINSPFLRKACFLRRLLWTPAARTKHCERNMMSGLLSPWLCDQPSSERTATESFSLVTQRKEMASAARVQTFGLRTLDIRTYRSLDWTWRSLDLLFYVAAELQIKRFLGAFHVTQLGTTHAHTTCSYSTSWETLIFNSFGR